MKVDPNRPIDLVVECVLCEGGGVTMFDGSRSTKADLDDPEGAFLRFCRTLDPNKSFIDAVVPDDADRDLFFAVREAGRAVGLHVQAEVDTPERHRAHWKAYVAARLARSARSDGDAGPGG